MTSDLFFITCTTCKSRLRVRDQAAIGQILACPKCGGMVMIKAPPAYSGATDQKSDLPTATELTGPPLRFDQTLDSSAFDVVDELLSDSPPKMQPPPSFNTPPPPPPSATPTPKPRFVGGPPARSPPVTTGGTAKPSASPANGQPLPPPAKSTIPTTSSAARSLPAASPTIHDSASLAPPPPNETKASQPPAALPQLRHPRQYWLLMAGSVGLGIALAFTAVAGTIFFLQPTRRTPAKSLVAAVKSPVVVANETVTSRTDGPQVDSAPAAAESKPLQSPSPTIAPTPTETPPAAAPATQVDADPLGLMKQPPTVTAAPTPTPSSDPLAKFDRLIGGASDDPLAKSTVAPAVPTTPPLPDAAPPRPLAPRPPPREIDVARRLADPLPAIETPGTPLAEFVQLMSDLSTIPITLDVPFVPATPESPVSLRLTNTTVGAALAEALKSQPVRLEYTVVDDQLMVRRAEPSKPTPFTAAVKDLTAGDEQQMVDLAELLKAVVAPAAWDGADESGTIEVDAAKKSLVITHPRSVQFQVDAVLAIEKLRSARTPPLAHLLKLPSALFQLDSRFSQAQPRLEKPISLNYSQPTRLVTILEHLGERAGVRILVDWRDVASAGWNPAGEASLVVDKQPLAAALDALLNPLDLTWRIIDGQTLQVVTPRRLAEQGELEFYKVGDLTAGDANGESLLAQVRAALGDNAFAGGGASGEVRYEPEGKCLLAWLPQPKQRELEALIAKWRGEKAK